uniref:EF-hand domain-containing protein n=1 Tax=candidate division WOR-3 bacterium TaxID=2052148 RepID=A0A7C3N909_UNCW3
MEYKLFIKCIFDRADAVEKNFFEQVFNATNIDIYTLKQKFVGKGWAILKKSEDEEEIIKIKNGLDSLKIESVILSDSDIFSYKIIDVSSIRQVDDYNIKFLSGNDEITISKNDTIFFVAGIDQKRIENVNLKKLLLENNFVFYIFTKSNELILRCEHEKLNYKEIKNFSKYSKSENFFKLYNSLKEFSQNFVEDLNYSENYVEDLFFDLKTYSVISSLLFKKGLYSFSYNKNFVNKDRESDINSLVYEFNYNIYKPQDIIFKKKSISINRFNLLEIFFIPFGIIFFGLLIFIRVGMLNISSYLFLLGSIYYIFYFFKVLKLKVFLESIPFSKLESISVGLNEIKGFITDDYSIPSPISGTRCVYFQYKKYRKVKDSEGKTKWQLEHIGEYLPEKFIVQDDEGNRISVKTNNATFNLKNKTVYTRTFYKFFSVEDSNDVKYEEEILPVMSEVFVVGSVVNKDYYKEKNDYIKNKKLDRDYMKNFDYNKDDVIDQDEWESAKVNIEKEFERKVNQRKETDSLEIVFSKDDKILFISDISEKTFLKYSNIFLISSLLMAVILIVLIFIFGGF